MSFSIDLSRAIKKANGRQEFIVKQVINEVIHKLIMKAPVDTGRFRANWQATQGSYSRTATNDVDSGDGSATERRLKSAVASMSLNGQTIYLCNALPYAVRLERGWSQRQAPHGTVRITLAELTAHYGT